jgi:hypothetical protein
MSLISGKNRVVEAQKRFARQATGLRGSPEGQWTAGPGKTYEQMILLSFAELLACLHLGYAMPCFPHERLKIPPVGTKTYHAAAPVWLKSALRSFLQRGAAGCVER